MPSSKSSTNDSSIAASLSSATSKSKPKEVISRSSLPAMGCPLAMASQSDSLGGSYNKSSDGGALGDNVGLPVVRGITGASVVAPVDNDGAFVGSWMAAEPV